VREAVAYNTLWKKKFYYREMLAQPALDMAAIGRRLRSLRQQRKLSLEALAERSGVSVSMLSTVERGQKVPSILVMGQIATGLDTSIGRLVGEEAVPRAIVMRAANQRVITDPAGIERRGLSPVLPGIEFELIRMTLPPGVDAGTFPPHRAGSREYLAVATGTLTLTLDGAEYRLHAGDSIYHEGDCEHGYRNDADTPCTYYLAMDVAGDAGR
jgi:XRE family transcriptional regulator, regulator of sulfur utilization